MVKRSNWTIILAVSIVFAFVTGGVLYAAYTQSAIRMHVEGVRINNRGNFGRNSRNAYDAEIWVYDQNGQPVTGAVVTGYFTGCFTTSGSSKRTDSYGFTRVLGRSVNCATSGPCAVTFDVSNVAKSGAEYVPAENVVDSDTLTVCR